MQLCRITFLFKCSRPLKKKHCCCSGFVIYMSIIVWDVKYDFHYNIPGCSSSNILWLSVMIKQNIDTYSNSYGNRWCQMLIKPSFSLIWTSFNSLGHTHGVLFIKHEHSKFLRESFINPFAVNCCVQFNRTEEVQIHFSQISFLLVFHEWNQWLLHIAYQQRSVHLCFISNRKYLQNQSDMFSPVGSNFSLDSNVPVVPVWGLMKHKCKMEPDL